MADLALHTGWIYHLRRNPLGVQAPVGSAHIRDPRMSPAQSVWGNLLLLKDCDTLDSRDHLPLGCVHYLDPNLDMLHHLGLAPFLRNAACIVLNCHLGGDSFYIKSPC